METGKLLRRSLNFSCAALRAERSSAVQRSNTASGTVTLAAARSPVFPDRRLELEQAEEAPWVPAATEEVAQALVSGKDLSRDRVRCPFSELVKLSIKHGTIGGAPNDNRST